MPASAAESPRRFHFGPYELDVRAGELRKNGLTIKLQKQPLQILKVLLERPGEVITREELRNQLWPADTFVDFDHSLNSAVKRLRDVLCDSGANPQFIETVPRYGYRFIGLVDAAGSATNSASNSNQQLERFRARKILIAVGVTFVVLLCSGIWLISRNIPLTKVIDSVQITKDGQHKDVTLKLLSDGARLYFQEGSFVGPLSTVAPTFAET